MTTAEDYINKCLVRIDELRQRWGSGNYYPLVPTRLAPDIMKALVELGHGVELQRVTDVSVILRIKYESKF